MKMGKSVGGTAATRLAHPARYSSARVLSATTTGPGLNDACPTTPLVVLEHCFAGILTRTEPVLAGVYGNPRRSGIIDGILRCTTRRKRLENRGPYLEVSYFWELGNGLSIFPHYQARSISPRFQRPASLLIDRPSSQARLKSPTMPPHATLPHTHLTSS